MSSKNNFTESYHTNSRRYNFLFSSLTCPPVDWAAPAKILSPCCVRLNVSLSEDPGKGATCIIIESSTKKTPTILMVSPGRNHLKDNIRP